MTEVVGVSSRRGDPSAESPFYDSVVRMVALLPRELFKQAEGLTCRRRAARMWTEPWRPDAGAHAWPRRLPRHSWLHVIAADAGSGNRGAPHGAAAEPP